ncbi:outer membrane beta-barrel protein [Sulfurovum sp. zt1-1]|uniref:Outer membrane beta-barrel protein n=1 Tax=Sulfurovum zhangzhouensis TaxID=3019067 RepID=A0ABT7QX32_9BACT|nr:outer membrane beta-barrel protein [Sulfurovum zhangzhouensis]MDM5271400.1 outer membrane beta-barrel protein [Sulfurovum zhangzhouensis]
MKNLTCSIVTALALSSFAVAGGNIEPVAAPMEEMAPAPDDSGFYIGGAYSFISADGKDYWTDGYREEFTTFDDIDMSGYMLLAGYQFNKYISVEGRYWGSSSEVGSITGSYDVYYDSVYSYTNDFWWAADGEFSAWGIYLKPMYPVGEDFTVYALLGYGNAQIDDNSWSPDWQLLDENGFQWGLGASYAYDEHLSFFADYVQLANDAKQSYDGGWYLEEWKISVYTINVGITYKF